MLQDVLCGMVMEECPVGQAQQLLATPCETMNAVDYMSNLRIALKHICD